jgi:hypothetical protein
MPESNAFKISELRLFCFAQTCILYADCDQRSQISFKTGLRGVAAHRHVPADGAMNGFSAAIEEPFTPGGP